MTASKFSLGDTIRIATNDNCGFPKGHIGTITEVCPTQYEVDHGYYYDDHELEGVQQRIRGFLRVQEDSGVPLPVRATRGSAGYDMAVTEDVVLSPGSSMVYPTGINSYMADDEYLAIHVRSSIGIKQCVVLSNGTSIIDSDFFPREIMIALRNQGTKQCFIEKGSRIAQGIFSKYLLCDNDNVNTLRSGGIGSSGK